MKRLLLTLTTTLLATVCLSGCNNGSQNTSDPSGESTSVEPIKTFTVRFLNYDDSVLETVNVAPGEAAKYSKVTPSKPATFDYYYEFKGWDKDFSKVTSNLDVKATYEEKNNHKELDPDFTFEVLEHSTTLDKNTTNYLGQGKKGKLYLHKHVLVDGEKVNYQSIDFDDMEFDYATVDFETVGGYPIVIKYAEFTVTDYIDVIPDISTWTLVRQYVGSASHNVNGPDLWMMEYIDFYDKGVIINHNSGKPYLSENMNDGQSVRFHRSVDGIDVDTAYDYFGEGLIEYSFPEHPDEVASLSFVDDHPTRDIGPTKFTLSIHQTFNEAPSAYGLLYDDEGLYSVAVKYDYDSSSNSIKIHLKAYPESFVYDETDFKYHH